VRRPSWVAAALVVLLGAGCTSTTGEDLPSTGGAGTLTVSSPDIDDGGPIPAEFTCDGADHPPVIEWSGASGRGSIVVLMTDRDANGFVHWLRYNLGGESGSVGGSSVDGVGGHNDFGTNGYRGPCPPQGDAPHHYVITVYEFAVAPSPFAPGEEASQVLGGNALAAGTITGTYARAG
jgi:Raf kinase inhibitor-like YbhB/YbcL family protein